MTIKGQIKKSEDKSPDFNLNCVEKIKPIIC
jgi:hypothetical protein